MSRSLFSALTAYSLAAPGTDYADSFAALPFVPCAPTQPVSIGFVPPRGPLHGPMAEIVGGQVIAKIKTERRLLPAAVVAARVEEMARAIEQETARKPGAKRRRELKDEAILELLPKAFTRQTSNLVWIAPALNLLVIDSTSTPVLDAALTLLIRAVPDLAVAPLATAESPAACMRAWLFDGVAAEGFGIGRQTLLRSPDATGASVKYSKHSLDSDNVLQHLREGKEVRELALNWKDRVDFVLADSLQLSKVAFDVEPSDEQQTDVDPFDANVLLATSELGAMLPALLAGLGGRIS